jgi:nucleotidyltransferase substrate binding protein (TIGR01987 family)
MEQNEKFQSKLKVYKRAVDGLNRSINIDTTVFPNDVADAIKNGCIQKFEYCTELTWKIIKDYLYIFHNIDVRSPREAIKQFFLINKVTKEDFELLLNILDDRNRLSHIYREEYFMDILNKLTAYHLVMEKVSIILENETFHDL